MRRGKNPNLSTVYYLFFLKSQTDNPHHVEKKKSSSALLICGHILLINFPILVIVPTLYSFVPSKLNLLPIIHYYQYTIL